MSTVIKLKYSNLTAQPADDLLQISEPAYSFTNGGRLFLGADNSGTIIPHVIGGKYFTDKLDHTPGTLTANSAIIVDANSKIDVLNIDNITIDGNTISSTDNNGNIVLDPNGTGQIQLNGPVAIASGNNFIVSDLTAGRVTFAGASSQLTDDANFTFNTTGAILTLNGQLNVDNIRVDANEISATDANGNVTITPNGTGHVDINTNQGVLLVARGTAGTRPTATNAIDGGIRYNSTATRFEGVVNGSWTGLGGVVDIDQDTYIAAEASADEDHLRFYTANVERLDIDNNGVSTFSFHVNVPSIGVDANTTLIDADTITINGSTIQGTGNQTLGTIILDPAPAAGDNGGDVIIRGNLQVTGATTTIESTVVTIEDPVMELGNSSVQDSLDRGIIANYFDGTTSKTAFFGWDRGVENAFTFVNDGAVANARFQNLKLEGSIIEVDGATPANGQILIGNGVNGDLQLNTLTAGDSISIVNSEADIEIDVVPAQQLATVDPYSELITAGSFESGVEYTIVSVNDGQGGATTDYTQIGSIDNTIGTVFIATGAGAGTGQARSTGTNYTASATAPTISVSNVTVGEAYEIVSVGTTTTWTELNSSLTAPNVGDTFTAQNKGSGDGTVKATNTAAQFAQYRGAASFASEQFTVTDGHVVITEIDGGQF